VFYKIPANLQEFPSVLASKSEKDAKVQGFSARPPEWSSGSKKACRFAGISLSGGYLPNNSCRFAGIQRCSLNRMASIWQALYEPLSIC